MERQNVLYTPHMLVVEDDTATSTWHIFYSVRSYWATIYVMAKLQTVFMQIS